MTVAPTRTRNAAFRYPTDDADLIQFLDKRWTEGTMFRASADIRAFWNIAFYHGHQWLHEAGTRSETALARIPVDTEDPNAPVMLTINKVGAYVDRAIAEMTESVPGVECRPGSDEESDIDAARVGTRISASEDNRMEMPTLLPRLYTWVVPAGYAFLQCTWNTQAGKFIGNDPDEKLTLAGIEKALFEGECSVEVVPHFEVVLDPMCVDSWDARWGIRQTALTTEEIYERYGVTLLDHPIQLNVLTDRLAQLSSEAGSRATPADRLAVRQFWLRPNVSRQLPEGMVFTWCGNTVLEARKVWPYTKQNRLPLFQFNFLPPQGGYMGRTPISDLIDLNIDYNRARSLEADISSRLIPKVFYDENSINPANTAARVEWIPVLAGAQPPTPWHFDPGWMQQHEVIMNRAKNEMDERMSMSDAARGQSAGTSPAAGVMAQQEAASKPYSVPAKEMARGLKRFGWGRLMLVRQYWKEERLVKTWSRAGTLAVDRFMGANLEGELDVQVRAESILPRSKAAQAQLAIQLLQAQVPGFDMQQFVRMIDLPGTDLLTEIFDADERQAERENSYIATRGKKAPPPPKDPNDEKAHVEWLAKLTELMPWCHPRDNHEMHIKTHRLHMISVEFENYPDKVKALFEAHISTHEAILATRQQAQMAQQAVVQPPGPGAAPPGQPAPGQVPSNGEVPSIEQLAGMGGGPGGGLSQPGVPPGVPADMAADFIGR